MGSPCSTLSQIIRNREWLNNTISTALIHLKFENPELEISNNCDYIQDEKCTKPQESWGGTLHNDSLMLHDYTLSEAKPRISSILMETSC